MAREDLGTERHLNGAPGRAPVRPEPRLAVEADGLKAAGAARPPAAWQWAAGVVALAGPSAGAAIDAQAAWAVLHPLMFGLFGVTALTRLAAALVPHRPEAAPPLEDAALPRYSVIVPLYREAEIVPGLIEALESLDYPRDRLQVLIVLEADDAQTWDALAALPLPSFIQVLAAPPGHPRTKPRACNVALERATGTLLTIYDAEDRPGPGQLREAAARFASGSARLACLQAPLRIDPARRFIAGQFGMEYAVQFEAVLPMLARLGLPFPLGGTSNHFRIAPLKALGGWDAWNVTEDADLGFRLAAEGYRLGVLATPTLECAPANLSEWLPQRSRWVKGYMQTFGVHARNPPHWRTGAALAFALTLGVSIAAAFLHGPLLAWALVGMILAITEGAAWISPADVVLLVIGWLASSVAAMVGARRAGRPLRAIELLRMPLYWPLHSLAAVHALHQLVFAPYRWDKTPHAARPNPETGAETGQSAA